MCLSVCVWRVPSNFHVCYKNIWCVHHQGRARCKNSSLRGGFPSIRTGRNLSLRSINLQLSNMTCNYPLVFNLARRTVDKLPTQPTHEVVLWKILTFSNIIFEIAHTNTQLFVLWTSCEASNDEFQSHVSDDVSLVNSFIQSVAETN